MYVLIGPSHCVAVLILLPYGDLDTANAMLMQFYQNNTDLNITSSVITPVPSFYIFFNYTLAVSNPTGGNVLLGSRLVPEDIVHNYPERIAQAFIGIIRQGKNRGALLGHLVAGGQVSRVNDKFACVRLCLAVDPSVRGHAAHEISLCAMEINSCSCNRVCICIICFLRF